jgi:hypothetical protein
MEIGKASTRPYVDIVYMQDLEVSEVQICKICDGESMSCKPVVSVPDLLLFVLQDAQKLRKHGTSIPEYAREEGVEHL